jgi:hypothetical protein
MKIMCVCVCGCVFVVLTVVVWLNFFWFSVVGSVRLCLTVLEVSNCI